MLFLSGTCIIDIYLSNAIRFKNTYTEQSLYNTMFNGRIQRGGGGGGRGSGRPPPKKKKKKNNNNNKKHMSIGHLSKNGQGPLKNHETTKLVFNSGSSSGRQQNAI